MSQSSAIQPLPPDPKYPVCSGQDYRIIGGDAMLLLENLEPESIDCIITDPPYWTLNKWRSVGTTTRLGGHRDEDKRSGWFETIDKEQLWSLLNMLFDVLKMNSHCYIMCDGQVLRYILGYADEIPWDYWKPLVWDKVNQGMGYHYRCRHEFIVMLEKGKRKLNSFSNPDILTHKMVRGGYPTEKPESLMAELIQQSTNPGECVFDPFMGSGATGAAALSLARTFLGYDISEDAFRLSWDRLDACEKQSDLFAKKDEK